MPTKNIGHLADSTKFEKSTINKIYSGLMGWCFEKPNAHIRAVAWVKTPLADKTIKYKQRRLIVKYYVAFVICTINRSCYSIDTLNASYTKTDFAQAQ